MKKLITILTIMIVLVGAVFAANTPEAERANGTAQIDVTAKIPESVPQFQLAVKSGDIASESDDVALGTVTSSGSGENITYTTTAASLTSVKAALTDDAITELGKASSSVTIGFAINQIADANLKAAYEITVVATDLLLKKYSDGTAFSGTQTSTQKFPLEATANTKMGAAPTVTATSASVQTGLTLTAAANKLSVGYTGAAKIAATDPILELGTFSVKWMSNATAVAGDYEANVTITVTSAT